MVMGAMLAMVLVTVGVEIAGMRMLMVVSMAMFVAMRLP
jgi:hypothetical protein